MKERQEGAVIANTQELDMCQSFCKAKIGKICMGFALITKATDFRPPGSH